MKPANSVISALGTTIFETMSRLAAEHGAINLGQGFPEGLEPPEVMRAAADAMVRNSNQYAPMMGLPMLRQAVADHAKRFYGLDYDWQAEVLVTSGATEALTDSLLALIEPGDEVVLLEPLYDSYLPMVLRAGGVPRLVRLEPPHWDLPRDALAAAFGPKTKLVILNSPMNPCGKVFTEEELAFVAGLVQQHDCYALCDEVYEHLVFGGFRHVPLATLPGMRDRCLRVGSAGKTFSLTGWKVGYLTGPAALIAPVAKAHQYVTFCTPPNLQAAVAHGLAMEDHYFRHLRELMEARRETLEAGLRRAGLDILPSRGSYFLVADIRPLGFSGDDAAFCRHIIEAAQVAAVPISAFYADKGPKHFVRFCFAKADEVLESAASRLAWHFKQV